MRIVVAPDSFKNALAAPRCAEAIARGLRRRLRDCDIITAPMADGGEGTLDVLVGAANGNRRVTRVTGPLGEPVEATVGLIRQASTAVIELASAAGFHLVPDSRRDPLKTTTYGVGQLIRAAIETGVDNIILGLGGSATVDGGAGMMQALGLACLDESGRCIDVRIAGGDLHRIHKLVWERPPEHLEDIQFTIACDVLNSACGPAGAAAVFGPQKGADAKGVLLLDRGLAHWADLLESMTRPGLRDEPGTGAAGGAALPLLGLLNATIVPGVDLVIEAIQLANRMADADLVITGEGRLDRQSLMGKVVGAVARLARASGIPCVAIVGSAGESADDCLELLDRYTALDCPLSRTETELETVAARLAGDLFGGRE